MFTWGDLKEIVFTGELEQLQRNKEMQHKYDIWSGGIKREYGSTGKSPSIINGETMWRN